jgi:glycosyltransferase XagB
VMWSFWLVALGLWHPLTGAVPGVFFWTLGGLFFISEAVNLTVGWLAVSDRKHHRFLRPWVPTLHLYFPLGALAAYKGAWELLTNPYYWDKTAHGLFDRTEAAPHAPDRTKDQAGG